MTKEKTTKIEILDLSSAEEKVKIHVEKDVPKIKEPSKIVTSLS